MNHPELSAVYCDDIRHEHNGKDIYIGVYSDEIILPELPYSMPCLTIAWAIRMPISYQPRRIAIEVFKGEERIVKMDGKISSSDIEIPYEHELYHPTLRGIIGLPKQSLGFSEPIAIALKARVDDYCIDHGPSLVVRAANKT